MEKQASEKLVNCHFAIQGHLEQIEKLFNRPVKITILVRTSDTVEGNVLLTNDTLQTVVEQLATMDGWQPTLKAGERV